MALKDYLKTWDKKRTILHTMGPHPIKKVRCSQPSDLDFLVQMFSKHDRETMATLVLDSDLHTVSLDMLGSGGEFCVNYCHRDSIRTPKALLREKLAHRLGGAFDACWNEDLGGGPFIMFLHNHPNEAAVQPSPQDKGLLEDLIMLGDANKITVLDMLIIGRDDSWISMKRRGYMVRPRGKYDGDARAHRKKWNSSLT
jgi:hypothetical protein